MGSSVSLYLWETSSVYIPLAFNGLVMHVSMLAAYNRLQAQRPPRRFARPAHCITQSLQ
jgi:hypothetical protein